MAHQTSRLREPASPAAGRWVCILLVCLVFLPAPKAALAQLELFQPPPDLPGLADPPLVQHALFENPVPLVILALLVALAAYAVAARLDRRKVGLGVAGGAILLGAAGVLLAGLVQTDRESVRQRTRETIAAIAEADTRTLDTIFDPGVRLYYNGLNVGWNSGRILSFVETYLLPGRQYQLESHRVRDVQSQIGPGKYTARTRATVVVTPVGTGAPTQVICLMTWRQAPDRSGPESWTLTEIQPLWVQGFGEITSRRLPRGF
ncbi:MAG: hypothetical protein Q9O74_04485 [Planctomycetota bacterium]|nr:hypothetical protein [Planctomycetota bacterium]